MAHLDPPYQPREREDGLFERVCEDWTPTNQTEPRLLEHSTVVAPTPDHLLAPNDSTHLQRADSPAVGEVGSFVHVLDMLNSQDDVTDVNDSGFVRTHPSTGFDDTSPEDTIGFDPSGDRWVGFVHVSSVNLPTAPGRNVTDYFIRFYDVNNPNPVYQTSGQFGTYVEDANSPTTLTSYTDYDNRTFQRILPNHTWPRLPTGAYDYPVTGAVEYLQDQSYWDDGDSAQFLVTDISGQAARFVKTVRSGSIAHRPDFVVRHNSDTSMGHTVPNLTLVTQPPGVNQTLHIQGRVNGPEVTVDDDAYAVFNGGFSSTSANLFLGKSGSTEVGVALRLDSLGVPPGARIEFAYIRFEHTDGVYTTSVARSFIRPVDQDNPSFPTSTSDFYSRPLLDEPTQSADLAVINNTGGNAQLISIPFIVQAAVDRLNYTDTDAFLVLLRGFASDTGAIRRYSSLEGVYDGPAIRVDYSPTAISRHTVDSPVLERTYVLVMSGAAHGHTSESPALVHNIVHYLDVADSLHTVTSDTVSVSGVLVADDAVHGHVADTRRLYSVQTLVSASCAHGHTAAVFTLTQAHLLGPADTLHTLTSESPTLVQFQRVLVNADDCLHGHSADPAQLHENQRLTMRNTGARHVHRADTVPITSVHTLTADACLHGHTVTGALSLTQAHLLDPADTLHTLTSESPTLVEFTRVLVNAADCVHGHVADTPSLVQAHTLLTDSCVHGHGADVPALLQDHSLMPCVREEVAASADDGQFTGSGAFLPAVATHTLGSDNNVAQHSFYRFSVNIPVDADVTHAYIDFEGLTGGDNGPANSVIVGQIGGARPTSYAFIENQQVTVAAVDWDHNPPWTSAQTRTTPGLASVLTELHAQGYWTPPQNVVFYVLRGDESDIVPLALLGEILETILPVLDGLNPKGGRIVAAADHGTVDPPKLTYCYSTLSETHTLTSDTPTLVQAHTLAVDSCLHGHTSEEPTLVEYQLVPVNADPCLHGHSAEEPQLGQAHALLVGSCRHGHTGDTVLLVEEALNSPHDTLHGHSAGGITLVQNQFLEPADCLHVHSAEQPTLVEYARVVLAVGSCVHDHVADAVTLNQFYVVQVAGTVHSVTSDLEHVSQLGELDPDGAFHQHTVFPLNVTLVQHQFLEADACVHAVTSDTVALSETIVYVLEPGDCLHDHAADVADLVQHFTLAVDETLHTVTDALTLVHHQNLAADSCVHSLTSDVPAFGQAHTLTVDGTFHGHTAEEPVLLETLQYFLDAASCLHDHAADVVALVQQSTLAVDETLHTVTDALTLVQHSALEPADCLHGHTVDALFIVQLYDLLVESALHDHSAEEPGLVHVHVIRDLDSLHGHVTDALELFSDHLLEPDGTFHQHTVFPFNITLVQHQNLTADACVHAVTSDEPALVEYARVLVGADPCLHGHGAEEPQLGQAHTVAVDDSLHTVVSDTVALVQDHGLAVEDTLHGHVSNLTDLAGLQFLDVASGLHGHTAEQPALAERISYFLEPADCFHAQGTPPVTLVQHFTLAVDDALHGHSSEAALVQHQNLATDSCVHALTSDVPFLGQAHTVPADSCLHGHTVDEVTLFERARVVLDAADCVHGHVSEAEIRQQQVLDQLDCLHTHVVETFVLDSVHTLTVESCLHGHVADGLELDQLNTLIVSSCIHDHTSDHIPFLQELPVPTPTDSCLHDHLADHIQLVETPHLRDTNCIHEHFATAVDLIQQHGLLPDDCLHDHTCDNVPFLEERPPLRPTNDRYLTVDPEDRALVVPPATRPRTRVEQSSWTIDAEDRTVTVAPEDRTTVRLPIHQHGRLTVLSDDRSQIVSPDERDFTVDPEDRSLAVKKDRTLLTQG